MPVVANSYASNSTKDGKADAKGQLLIGAFTSKANLDALHNTQVAYTGTAQNRWSSDGRFSYIIDFTEKTGSGGIKYLENEEQELISELILERSEGIRDLSSQFGAGAYGFADGVVSSKNSQAKNGSYQLAFFGDEAQEVAGNAEVTIDNTKYDITFGGSRSK